MNARNLADLHDQFGEVGLVNGPRLKRIGRTVASCEAYQMRRFVDHLIQRGDLKFPISLPHRDARDFEVEHPEGRFYVEVSEVCPPEDGLSYIHDKDDRLLGGDEDFDLDAELDTLIGQIQDSIQTKATKVYAGSDVKLLLYLNSPAGFPVRIFGPEAFEALFHRVSAKPFGSVYALLGDQFYVTA